MRRKARATTDAESVKRLIQNHSFCTRRGGRRVVPCPRRACNCRILPGLPARKRVVRPRPPFRSLCYFGAGGRGVWRRGQKYRTLHKLQLFAKRGLTKRSICGTMVSADRVTVSQPPASIVRDRLAGSCKPRSARYSQKARIPLGITGFFAFYGRSAALHGCHPGGAPL